MTVICDFPVPADDAGLRSAPGRVMSGIQFFEARSSPAWRTTTWLQVTPMHAVTYGRVP